MNAKKEPPDSEYTTRDVYRRKARERQRRWRARQRELYGPPKPKVVTCPWCFEDFYARGYYAHEQTHKEDPSERGRRGVFESTIPDTPNKHREG